MGSVREQPRVGRAERVPQQLIGGAHLSECLRVAVWRRGSNGSPIRRDQILARECPGKLQGGASLVEGDVLGHLPRLPFLRCFLSRFCWFFSCADLGANDLGTKLPSFGFATPNSSAMRRARLRDPGSSGSSV